MKSFVLLILLLFAGCKDPLLVVEDAKHVLDDDNNETPETVITPTCVYPLDLTQPEIDGTIYGGAGYQVFTNTDSTYQKWLMSSTGSQSLHLGGPTGIDLLNPIPSPRAITFPAGNFAFEIDVRNISVGSVGAADPNAQQGLFALAFTNQSLSAAAFYLSGIYWMQDGSFISKYGTGGAQLDNGSMPGTVRIGHYYDATAKTMTYYLNGVLLNSHAVDLSATGPFVIVSVGLMQTGSAGDIEFDLILDKSQFTGTYPVGTTDICGQ